MDLPRSTDTTLNGTGVGMAVATGIGVGAGGGGSFFAQAASDTAAARASVGRTNRFFIFVSPWFQAPGIFSSWPGWMRSGFLTLSLFASQISFQRFPSP